MVIRALPRAVVDRIAAGEVVERPASVVKELLENALDARSTSIQVEIEQGGLGLIRVADDGTGMSREDLALVFASHATSKLTDVGDLEHIASFGFRGEALSSIGAISRARITTATAQDGEGWSAACSGGDVTPPQPHAAARGTVLEIRDLFFNTPARRRFLGAAATEAARCRQVVMDLSLVQPGVRLSIRVDGRMRFATDGPRELADRVEALHGADLRRELVPVSARGPGVSVEGLISLPAAARPRPRLQLLFVNDRLVIDRSLAAAVRVACKDVLPPGLQAHWVLALHVDPARVDVNVHPTKAEVRFRDKDAVFRLIRRACRDTLMGADLAPRVRSSGVSLYPSVPRDRPAEAVLPGLGIRPPAPPAMEAGHTPRAESVAEQHPAVPAPAVAARPAPVTRYLQIHDTYLVHESPEGLVLVDQHALHERILYSRLKTALDEGRIPSQRLLVPETVRLSPGDHARALQRTDELARLGLSVEPFGPDVVAVHAVPAVLRNERVDHLLLALLDPPDVHGGIPHDLDRRLFTMACHAAVKAGDPLDEAAITDLLRQGEALEHDATCPHGRPTRLVLSVGELEKLFKRTGF